MRVMPPQTVNEGVIIGDEGKVQVRILKIQGDSVVLEISGPGTESPRIVETRGDTVRIELPQTVGEPLEPVH